MAELAVDEQIEDDIEEVFEQPSASSDFTVILNDRYHIDGGQPLVFLDSPNALAYEVSNPRTPDMKLFALVCDPGLPVRVDAMMKLKQVSPNGLLPLADWGVIDWPLTGQKTTAVIYERPMGGRLTDVLSSGASRISEYDIITRVLKPALSGIGNLAEHEITHR
ncbi:MAG: hypothetical protein HON65_01210, partial [Rhodospirillales bacterium]|nr:hypothetical protein [Rhodospirillales bacterium]